MYSVRWLWINRHREISRTGWSTQSSVERLISIIDQQLESIRQCSLKRVQLLEKEAEALMSKAENDVQYQTYCRVHKLWEDSGLAKLAASYKRLDRNVGYDRVARGDMFESTKATQIVALVVKQLLKEGLLVPEDAPHVKYLTGLHWLHVRGSQCNESYSGEIDIALYLPSKHLSTSNSTTSSLTSWTRLPNTRLSEAVDSHLWLGHAIALVEMKSHCFELSSAFRQHSDKLADASNYHLVHKTQSLGYTYLTIGANTECGLAEEVSGLEAGHQQESSIGQGHQQGSSIGHRLLCSPCLFVATVIPAHDYILGAEPKTVNKLASYVCMEAFDFEDEATLSSLHSLVNAKLQHWPSPRQLLTLPAYAKRVLVVYP